MCAKFDVPFLIAEERVELAHCWIISLVAPSKFPVLQAYLFKLTHIECVAETDNSTPINICTVFVSSSIYLVKVTGDRPFVSSGGLLLGQLLEEGVFEVSSSRAVDRC